MTTTEFTVTGMTCEHCERAVKSEVGEIDGVTTVSVSAATGHLAVTTNAGPVDTDAVLAAVDEAGYSAEAV